MTTNSPELQKINFQRTTTDLGIIANTATAQVALESLQTQFGLNFNSLIITNAAAEELIVILDGLEFAHIPGGLNSVLSFDWRDGITYNTLQIKNNDAAASTAANEIRISVGRTGVGVENGQTI